MECGINKGSITVSGISRGSSCKYICREGQWDKGHQDNHVESGIYGISMRGGGISTDQVYNTI